MLSGNVGRSQGIRRMLSASTKKYDYVVGHYTVGQIIIIKHCENVFTCNETFIFIAR